MLYIGNTRYRIYSGGDRVSIECPEKLDLVIKNTLLPSGLELYESLKSDGNCYIDTKFVPTGDNHRVSIKINIASINTTSIFGCLNSTPLLVLGFNGAIWVASSTNSTNRNKTVLSSGISIVDFTTNNDTVNYTVNNTSGTYSAGTDLSAINKSIFLFANNNNPRQYSSDTIFYFRFYELGILVRNMIPCTYYGEPGMWDTVENKFYGNEGSGEFILGNKVVLKEYEYLLSVQGAYIDTGIDNNSNSLRMDLNFRPIQTTGNKYYTGNYANNDGLYFEYISGSDGWQWAWRCAYKQITKTPNTSLPETHSFYVENGTSIFLINGNIIQSNTLNKDGGRIYIGGSKISSSNTIATYWCKITNNGQLIKDFIPCSYNGIPGLWDKIELKFYGNAGSGTFIVSNEIKYYDYLQTDGNSWIDTGLKGNLSTEVNIRFTPKSTDNMGVFGASEGVDNRNCLVLARSEASLYLYALFGNKAGTIIQNVTLENGKFYNITINNTSYIVNDILVRSFSDTNSFITIDNLVIGKILLSTKLPYKGLIYGCTIKDNEVLVKDYRPCLYNGVAGLWDSVERKFYGNANNTGTLTVGNNS